MLGLKLNHQQRLHGTMPGQLGCVCKEMTNFPIPAQKQEKDLFSQRMATKMLLSLSNT